MIILRIPIMLTLTVAVWGLLGCAPKSSSSSLNSIQKLNYGSHAQTNLGAIRAQALRDTALSVGARGGLAFRAQQINAVLLRYENMIYRLFNFNAMMLEKNVLPPVLTEGRNTLSLGGTDTIRVADRTYQILNQARFVTAAPNWRDYLWLSYSPPEAPDRTLLPRNREERIVWKKYTEEGWQAGLQQADLIFKESIARLKRDYEGMIRYRTLLAQNMVSPPFVAQMDMGVTGGGSDLTVNDRVLRITAFPTLQNESKDWKTEITPNE
jgi:defect-in-organelle-trafficking protein DotC